MSRYHRHWVPAHPKREYFPFTYVMRVIEEHELKEVPDIDLEYLTKGTTLETIRKDITKEVLRAFDYYKYLNKFSPLKGDLKNYYFHVRVKLYEEVGEGRKKEKNYVSVKDYHIGDFKSDYSFNLVENLDQLKTILKDKTKIAFDTETTGLNPETDYIVGVSISTKDKEGYYIPIRHSEEFSEYNLGYPALRIIYEALMKAEIVYMFNARFDMRMLEYSKDTEFDYNLEGIKVIDTQLTAYFADPEYRRHDLKSLEKHFLGYFRDDLKDVLKGSGINTFDFSLINPKLGLFYASQDAISTFELGEATYKYYKEFGIAGQIDVQLMFILMRLENHSMKIDKDFLEAEYKKIVGRLEYLNTSIYEQIGEVNLNSSAQREQLFRSFNLDTGKRTDKGAMKTGVQDILDMIDRLKAEGKEYPKWLELFDERSKLEKLSNTFFGRLLEQVDDENDRIRINYRLGITSTGRLSSGKELEY